MALRIILWPTWALLVRPTPLALRCVRSRPNPAAALNPQRPKASLIAGQLGDPMSADLDQNVAGKNFLIVDLWHQIPKALFAVIRALRSAAAQLFFNRACTGYRSPASASASVNSPAQYRFSVEFIFNHFPLAVRSTDGQELVTIAAVHLQLFD